MRKWTKVASLRPIWDCYQTIAEHLLAMPVPPRE